MKAARKADPVAQRWEAEKQARRQASRERSMASAVARLGDEWETDLPGVFKVPVRTNFETALGDVRDALLRVASGPVQLRGYWLADSIVVAVLGRWNDHRPELRFGPRARRHFVRVTPKLVEQVAAAGTDHTSDRITTRARNAEIRALALMLIDCLPPEAVVPAATVLGAMNVGGVQ